MGSNLNRLDNPAFIGQKFNRLTVVGILKDTTGQTVWKCKCDCGNYVERLAKNIKHGEFKSCGCISKELQENGHCNDRLYCVYHDMVERCYYEGHASYKNYGGRGIRVCDEWRSNYLTFKAWAYSHGYDENAAFGDCTIDRIEVNGNYEPSNCRWVDSATQAANKRPRSEWKPRKVKKYRVFGELKSVAEICKEYSVSEPFLRHRLKGGMSLEQAITLPKLTDGRPRKDTSADAPGIT